MLIAQHAAHSPSQDQEPSTTKRREVRLLVEEVMMHLAGVSSVAIATYYPTKTLPTAYLQRKLQSILVSNPWLTGRIIRKEPVSEDPLPEIYLDFQIRLTQQEALDLVKGRHFQELHLPALTPGESNIEEVIDSLEPHKVKDCRDIANTSDPLFKITSITTDEANNTSRSILLISMSHLIGDAWTMYKIYSMLSWEVTPFPLDPVRDFVAEEEIHAKHKDTQAFMASPGLGANIGRLVADMGKLHRDYGVAAYVVDVGAVQRAKEEYVKTLQSNPTAATNSFVSTNDILTSFLLTRSAPAVGLIAYAYRGKSDRLPSSSQKAGNYFTLMGFSAKDYAIPSAVRARLTRVSQLCVDGGQTEEEPSSLPMDVEFERVASITEWTRFYHHVVLESDDDDESGGKVLLEPTYHHPVVRMSVFLPQFYVFNSNKQDLEVLVIDKRDEEACWTQDEGGMLFKKEIK